MVAFSWLRRGIHPRSPTVKVHVSQVGKSISLRSLREGEFQDQQTRIAISFFVMPLSQGPGRERQAEFRRIVANCTSSEENSRKTFQPTSTRDTWQAEPRRDVVATLTLTTFETTSYKNIKVATLTHGKRTKFARGRAFCQPFLSEPFGPFKGIQRLLMCSVLPLRLHFLLACFSDPSLSGACVPVGFLVFG